MPNTRQSFGGPHQLYLFRATITTLSQGRSLLLAQIIQKNVMTTEKEAMEKVGENDIKKRQQSLFNIIE